MITDARQIELTFRAAIDAYTAQDVERLLGLFSEDGVMQDMADPDHPFEGKENLYPFVQEYFGTLNDVQSELTSVSIGENVAIGELEVRANYVATPFSPENPCPVRIRYCVVDTFRDGQIVRERFYWDRASFERQLA